MEILHIPWRYDTKVLYFRHVRSLRQLTTKKKLFRLTKTPKWSAITNNRPVFATPYPCSTLFKRSSRFSRFAFMEQMLPIM